MDRGNPMADSARESTLREKRLSGPFKLAKASGFSQPGAPAPYDVQEEFGVGFVYNMILFAKHAERLRSMSKGSGEELEPIHGEWMDQVSTWAYAAFDHLYGIEVPPRWKGTKWEAKLLRLVEDVGKYRLYAPSDARSLGSYSEALRFVDSFYKGFEELAMEVDRQFLGLTPIKANWN